MEKKKTFNKVGIEGIYHNIIKVIYHNKLIANIILSNEGQKLFLCYTEQDKDVHSDNF